MPIEGTYQHYNHQDAIWPQYSCNAIFVAIQATMIKPLMDLIFV